MFLDIKLVSIGLTFIVAGTGMHYGIISPKSILYQIIALDTSYICISST